MASEVLMPALSPTMTEGKIARWVKNVGEPVRAGDVLAEIETDKATMEVEAVDEGVLAKIVIPEGTDHVAVNTPIAVIAENGEDVAEVEAKPRPAPPQAKAPQEPPEQEEEPTPAARDRPVAPARPAPTLGAEPSEYTGKTVTQTVREALRDAIAEEMRRDSNVLLIGEEVAEYQGAYKVSQGLLQEFGPRRVIDTPITEQGLRRARHRRRLCRAAPDRRVHDLQFRDAGYGPADQLGGQDALHVGRTDVGADRVPRPQRHRLARRGAAFAMLRQLVRACAGAQGSGALYRR
jgi:pyruvate/2-oxoglutarate dehydrogenase complex dihydrolipoamide acyltransferase (E2) component